MLSIFKLVLSPKTAIYLASLMVGRPDIADDLIAICNRESRCQEVEMHQIDAHLSSPEWHGQVHWGHLDPKCQKKKAKGGWATQGILGLSAGAHWKYLPPCYQPEALHNPIVSAIIGARKYVRTCWSTNKKNGWCHVPRKVRKNNLKSPKLKKAPEISRPEDWNEFITKNPW